ncbi:hypothetical protein KP509_03G016300 [Ceratopteris richardii]|uniref:Uncharacterized protein n=1 Tax=Ceratopteris richardii TaxID=49495 RepID=A0A8T2UXR0_CERRI|nr:hypothetical protein KP509_03G016300 [Ceratopteris richardii]
MEMQLSSLGYGTIQWQTEMSSQGIDELFAVKSAVDCTRSSGLEGLLTSTDPQCSTGSSNVDVGGLQAVDFVSGGSQPKRPVANVTSSHLQFSNKMSSGFTSYERCSKLSKLDSWGQEVFGNSMCFSHPLSTCDEPSVYSSVPTQTNIESFLASFPPLNDENNASKTPSNIQFGSGHAVKDKGSITNMHSSISTASREASLSPSGSYCGGQRAGIPLANKDGIGMNASNVLQKPGNDHIMAERKRREKLSQRFIALSAIVPGLKKVCSTRKVVFLVSFIVFSGVKDTLWKGRTWITLFIISCIIDLTTKSRRIRRHYFSIKGYRSEEHFFILTIHLEVPCVQTSDRAVPIFGMILYILYM